VTYVACIKLLLLLLLLCRVSQNLSVKLHIYIQYATNCMAKCTDPNTVVNQQQNLFCSCLTWTLLI